MRCCARLANRSRAYLERFDFPNVQTFPRSIMNPEVSEVRTDETRNAKCNFPLSSRKFGIHDKRAYAIFGKLATRIRNETHGER